MGTRADFYVGKGKDAEWLGSTAFDGYYWADCADSIIMQAASADVFRVAVNAMLRERDDATTPEQGWPWPWSDSHTTDFAYCFADGKVTAYCFGKEYQKDADAGPRGEFPDMSDRKNVTFGHRSGMIIVGG